MILYFVGQASALGLPITIPIILWSLSASTLGLRLGHFPLILSYDFCQLLDASVDKDSPVRLVEKYLNNWWNGDNKVDLKYALNGFLI